MNQLAGHRRRSPGCAYPARIEIDNKNDYVYVLDAGNGLSRALQPRTASTRWRCAGRAVPFSKPLGLAVNSDGDEVLVADTENNIVQKFTLR